MEKNVMEQGAGSRELAAVRCVTDARARDRLWQPKVASQAASRMSATPAAISRVSATPVAPSEMSSRSTQEQSTFATLDLSRSENAGSGSELRLQRTASPPHTDAGLASDAVQSD